MAIFRYTALRSLVAPAVVGSTVDLDVGLFRLEERRRGVRQVTEAIGGRRTTLLDRIETTYQVETTVSRESDLPRLRMFLDSVLGGEPFTFLSGIDTWVPGLGAYAAVSPGNYLRLLNPGAAINGRSAWTLSFWGRKSIPADAGDGFRIGRDNLKVIERSSTADAMTLLLTSGGFSGQATTEAGTGATPVDDGAWHQWTITFSAGEAVIYLDGQPSPSQTELGTLPAVLPTSSTDWLIGGATPGTTEETHDVARMAMWGAAASAAQVDALYQERRDLSLGAGLTLGTPLIWAPLGDLTVAGSIGGTLATVGSPQFIGQPIIDSGPSTISVSMESDSVSLRRIASGAYRLAFVLRTNL